MQSSKSILLILLAAILFAKYAVVPWYETQNEQIAELTITSRKLAKATALQDQKEALDAESVRLSTMKVELEKTIPTVADHNAISLEIQKDWQLFFESQGTELKLFNWTGQTQTPDTDYWVGRVSIKLVGRLHEIAAATIRLQQKNSGLSFSSITMNQAQGLLFSEVSEAEISIDVLYKLRQP